MEHCFCFSGWQSPSLGAVVILVPVVGAVIIGFMARYGSERIRGHGIPEAIEAILISGSRIEPRVAFLKPLSSAISIGSGGPFGAEGPIIMTGGAFGSMVAQFMHLTSAERKTLLVAERFTVLTLRRSILTEKVARRGYHLSREYAVDPMEILFVREVMRTNIAVLPANISVKDLAHSLRSDHRQNQRLYPVVDDTGHLTGVLTRGDLQKFLHEHPPGVTTARSPNSSKRIQQRLIRTSRCVLSCTGWRRRGSRDFSSSNAVMSASWWGLFR
jgi:CBS domain-containing protein